MKKTVKRLLFLTSFFTTTLGITLELQELTNQLNNLRGTLSILQPPEEACADFDPAIKYSDKCFYQAPKTFKASHQPIIATFCWESVVLLDSHGEFHQFGKPIDGDKDPRVPAKNWHPTLGTRYKGDVLIWNNGFEHWNWKLDGTSHEPGITGKALEKLVNYADDNLDVIILTQGVEGKLIATYNAKDEEPNKSLEDAINKIRVKYHNFGHLDIDEGIDTEQDLNKFIKVIKPAKGKIRIIELKSFDAVRLYNALVNEGINVAMLLHTTC